MNTKQGYIFVVDAKGSAIPWDKIFAKPWDVVVCSNNHPCLLVLKEIRIGDPISEKSFRALGKMQQPSPGQVLSRTLCPECDEPLFSVETNIFKLQRRQRR